MVKVCGMCGQEKTWDQFNRHDHTRYCISTYCKDCHSAYNRNRYKAEREKVIARSIRNREIRRKAQEKLARDQKKRDKGIVVPHKTQVIKSNKKASLKEYREVVKNQPISISDLLN